MENHIEIRQTPFDTEHELEQLVELQNIVYKERGLHFTCDTFRFWYLNNPLGRVLAFGAFDGDKMVAHYACIPIQMMIAGTNTNGILSMAVVTHPDYRGRGLFRTLAAATYDLAKQKGYDFVVGVANANSFPGFMKYFPFQFIGRLEVKWGWGDIIIPTKTFYRAWTPETIAWRVGKRAYTKHDGKLYSKYKNIPFIKLFIGQLFNGIDAVVNKPKPSLFRPFTLYIGIGADLSSGHYFNLPKFVKHSPFNLRFMDLTEDQHLPEVNKDNIVFQLIDFDVA